MTETSHGLRLQASNAIAMTTRLKEEVDAKLNQVEVYGNDLIVIPQDLLHVVSSRLANDILVIQKQAKKIEELLDTISNFT